jgi:predicted ATPase
VTEALRVAQQSGRHYWEAELHRMRGVLTIEVDPGQGRGAMADAESHFLQAIAIARRQQARSLELRAATSLARLWGDRGNVREAHELLAGVYGWFTEGFDTADLMEAKTLLEELEARDGVASLREKAEQSPHRNRGEQSA